MRRPLFSFFSLLALASLLLSSACSSANGDKAGAKATPTPLPTPLIASKPTYKVQKGDVTSVVQFSARIIPAVQDELYFRTSGRVRKVYAKSGDEVKKGQVLADLITLDQLESQAKEQEFALRKAQINYESAWLRQQLAATQTPNWDAGYDIKMKLNAYDTELAQIALDETKLQSQNLSTNISDAQITASMDGKVLSMSIMEGDDAKAFDPLITVGDDTKLEVGATLTTEEMQNLSENMPVTIDLPDRPGQPLTGKIRQLPYPYGTGGENKTGNSANSNPVTGQSADTTTRISLDNQAEMKNFRLGDLVDVTVTLKSVKNVLWLPPQAIRTFEGRNFVVVKNANGMSSRTDIKIGIQNEDRVEVQSGLKEGQEVVSP